MGLIPTQIIDPKRPETIVQAVEAIIDTLNGGVSIGHPQDPADDASTTLAGGTGVGTHNGTLLNVAGSFVELQVTSLDTNVSCLHYLDLAVPSASQPNVRWLVLGYQHDGVGVTGGTDTISCNYENGTVTANDCPLRFYAGPNRTVGVSNPLKVTLFFMPAVRGVAE